MMFLMAIPKLLLLLLPFIELVFGGQAEYALQSTMLRACHKIQNQSDCLDNLRSKLESTKNPKDPKSVLAVAMEMTHLEAMRANNGFSMFETLSSVDSRESLAVEDCKELLDFSVSELAWSLDTMRKIHAGSKNHHHRGNLKAWLSAALSNQDTCLEGFEGTDRRVERVIRGSLAQVTQLIGNVLVLYSQMHSLPFKQTRNDTRDEEGKRYPKWMSEGDKELFSMSSTRGLYADSVVAQDGSGHYQSITEAVNNAPSYSNRRYIIYIKKGVYKENIDLKKKKTNIMFMGDGIGATVVTGDRNFLQGWTTFRTATVAVSGKGFIARDMTFRNTAGPENRQAVALRVDSDQSAFYKCSMEGHQDTLYLHSLRQFYRECDIYGTIDFIFGNGAAVFQNCRIFTRVPLPLQKVTITAQGRKDPHQSTGFTIQDSFIYATQPTYLGRPWKQYSRTVFLNTYMTGLVQPRGWLEWYGDFALGTLWYGEYKSYGPGGSLIGRVNWPGYHIIQDSNVAKFFTAGNFIDGFAWLPHTGIKFKFGLN
ncbi:putative pectinesterase/pectinesterase inhibitor 22 [Impatiens glandulifera]|uniref:putative pectinesterase/pectinesterase inhibitor 22 n=1 Tax=Impatiens glandulifera TaxID=253017 RepID=UPI001FB11A75|nr:putative pectinesterase/pectinesterase inhibitor 22 [Impatiens glandulifera]